MRSARKLFAVHHWCGLIAGTVLLVISLTGSVLVFDDDIDGAVFAEHKRLPEPAERISFDASYDHVRRAFPGWEIRVPELPSKHEAILYELRQGTLRTWVFAHPETGQVLSQIDRADLRLTNVLLNIHYNLFAGTPGKIVVLCAGIAFLALLVTGIIIYRRSILHVLLLRQKISFRNRKIAYSSLHRVLGVWGLLFNLLMCLSGIWLGYLVVDSALKKKNTDVDVPPLAYSIDAALQSVQTSYPEFIITYMRFPLNAEGSLQMLGRLKSDPAVYGRYYSGVKVNADGTAGGALFLKDKPWYERYLRVLQPLHFGDYAGLPVKILYSVGGIVPAVLSVSGFALWWSRRRKKSTEAQPVARRAGMSVSRRPVETAVR